MTHLTFENVWKNKTDELIQEIIAKWESLGALPSHADGLKRARQVVYLVRNEAREIVGICTVFNISVEQLHADMMAFRALLDPNYRVPGLLQKMVTETFNYLESIQGELHPKPLGMLVEIENANLLKLKKAVTSTGLVFIGYSRRGLPLRVRYFKNAEIDYQIRLTPPEQ